MDVAIAIDAEAIDVPLSRGGTATGSYDEDGDLVAAAIVNSTIRGTVQPATGAQLMSMPEGVRIEAQFVIWTRTALLIDDRITYDGKTWRVVYLWPRPVDGFTRAAIGKL